MNYLNRAVKVEFYVEPIDENIASKSKPEQYYVDTPAAAEAFMRKLNADLKYKDYKCSLYMAITDDNGEIDSTGAIFEDIEIMDLEIDDADKLKILWNMLTETGMIDDIMLMPCIRLCIEFEDDIIWKTFDIKEYDMDAWWLEFIEEANQFLESLDTEGKGDFIVSAYVATPGDNRAEYFCPERKKVISVNAIKKLDYYDAESLIMLASDMFQNGFLESQNGMGIIILPNEFEKSNREVFGDGYYQAISFVSQSKKVHQKDDEFQHFVTSMVVNNRIAILDFIHIEDGDHKESLEIKNGWNADFITVAVDEDYIESGLFDKEVLSFDCPHKTVIVYEDDARLSEEQLGKLHSYFVYDSKDKDIAKKLDEYLEINRI